MTGSATSITANGATLNSTITTNGAPGVTAWFDWKNTLALGNSTVAQSTTGGAVSQALTGLSPATTYYFRGATQKSGGTPVYDSNIITFTTLASSASSPTITTNPATTVTATSAPLNGSVAIPINNGLVAWWTMDSSSISGTTLTDVSGNGNTGTITGTNVVAGKVGQGLQFNGSPDTVAVPNQDRSAFTFSTWVKRAAINTNRGDGPLILAANFYGWGAYIEGPSYNAGNNILFGKIGSWQESSAGTIDANWPMVTISYDGTQIKFYIDGVLDKAVTHADTFNSSSGAYNLGARPASSNYFKGIMDETRIYNRVLTASDVADLYKVTSNTAWFDWGTTSSLGNSTAVQSTTGGSITQTITGLTQGTNYYVRAAVQQSGSSPSTGQTLTFTTADVAPDALPTPLSWPRHRPASA